MAEPAGAGAEGGSAGAGALWVLVCLGLVSDGSQVTPLCSIPLFPPAIWHMLGEKSWAGGAEGSHEHGAVSCLLALLCDGGSSPGFWMEEGCVSVLGAQCACK